MFALLAATAVLEHEILLLFAQKAFFDEIYIYTWKSV
jgi:hypothetical protein